MSYESYLDCPKKQHLGHHKHKSQLSVITCVNNAWQTTDCFFVLNKVFGELFFLPSL